MTPALVVLAVATGLAAGPAPASVQQLVFVDAVATKDKALDDEAEALTQALCIALGKDARLDVLCATDVRQVLAFAASAAMVGSKSPAADVVEERLARARHLVTGTLARDGSGRVWNVSAGMRDADSPPIAPVLGAASLALELRAKSHAELTAQAPAAAGRVAAALLPPAPPGAPPAPLKR